MAQAPQIVLSPKQFTTSEVTAFSATRKLRASLVGRLPREGEHLAEWTCVSLIWTGGRQLTSGRASATEVHWCICADTQSCAFLQGCSQPAVSGWRAGKLDCRPCLLLKRSDGTTQRVLLRISPHCLPTGHPTLLPQRICHHGQSEAAGGVVPKLNRCRIRPDGWIFCPA